MGNATLRMNDLSGIIVDTAYHIHKGLGPGLLEKVYEVVFAKQFQKKGLSVERQKPGKKSVSRQTRRRRGLRNR